MTNKEIAGRIQGLARIMELHDENPFKIRSYANAYITLRKWSQPLIEMSVDELASIKGIGKSVSAKIRELAETGMIKAYEDYKAITPPGILELLQVKGFGPKKIKQLWRELEVESVGEALYACNENRLIELKGFREKSQEDLRQKLEYFLRSRDKFLFATVEKEALELLKSLKQKWGADSVSFVGKIRRRMTTLEKIEVLIKGEVDKSTLSKTGLNDVEGEEGCFTGRTSLNFPISIYYCKPEHYGTQLFNLTGPEEFASKLTTSESLASEEALFETVGWHYIPPALRDHPDAGQFVLSGPPDLIVPSDIKGVVHTHTLYSDGLHTISEMAENAEKLGYSYIVISDHSKSAFYASGLREKELEEQWREIGELNASGHHIRILKGIESDILNDGRLDYDDDLMAGFDVVIASIHSNLKMDEAKATQRLITAIEHPSTNILGHPTGRLLLARQGYPIDHKKVIDACVANGVAIELNANPHRLDLDWALIPYALDQGALISINPDAHSREGIEDIHYGVLAAQKGGLTREGCLNAKSLEEFLAFCGGG